MSVIVKYPDGTIKLLIKGSDTSIGKRLADTQHNKDLFIQTEEYLANYAKEGLRTLLLAEKIIPFDEYFQWSQAYFHASCQIKERETFINKVAE